MKGMALLIVVVLASCKPKPPARPHELIQVQPVEGIEVDIAPSGFVAWWIKARNHRGTPVKLLWDESSFVGADGRSFGRLMRGRTKVIDATKAQLSSTIVPDSYLLEFCIPEDLIDAGPTPRQDGGVDYSSTDPVRKGVGRMVLVFETAAGRETWEGALSFDGTKPAQPVHRQGPATPPASAPSQVDEAPAASPALESPGSVAPQP